jgi:hypothetical protein
MGGGKRIGRRNRLRADAKLSKTLEQNLCCCCGLFLATQPNGLCKDCADNCAGYLLKDKPCQTTEGCKILKRELLEEAAAQEEYERQQAEEAGIDPRLADVESRAEKEARDEKEEEEMAEKMRSEGFQ